MTAIRSVSSAEGKFVQISNAAAQDQRLSGLARAIILLVLSLPSERHLTASWLETQFPEGRRAVRRALGELETCGYYRRTRTSRDGTWVWEQVISDAPVFAGESEESASPQVSSSDRNRSHDTTCGNASSQVDASDRFASDASAPDANRSDKDLNTEEPKDEDQKMVQGRASRRAHASGERAERTTTQAIAEIREAIAEVHSRQEADDLSDGEVLGLYFTYASPAKKPVRDLTAYMAKILSDAPYLDTFMANVEAVCIPCWHWESDCRCGQPAQSAA